MTTLVVVRFVTLTCLTTSFFWYLDQILGNRDNVPNYQKDDEKRTGNAVDSSRSNTFKVEHDTTDDSSSTVDED